MKKTTTTNDLKGCKLAPMTMVLRLTPADVDTLIDTLAHVAMEMDDDGRDGAFDASDIGRIYKSLRAQKQGR